MAWEEKEWYSFGVGEGSRHEGEELDIGDIEGRENYEVEGDYCRGSRVHQEEKCTVAKYHCLEWKEIGTRRGGHEIGTRSMPLLAINSLNPSNWVI